MNSETSDSVTVMVSLLSEQGWVGDGETASQSVRIPTTKSPLLGAGGGEPTTFGGRLRFKKGTRRATVGKRTTCFYWMGEKGPTDFTNVPTKDLEQARRILSLALTVR